jgi:sortase A
LPIYLGIDDAILQTSIGHLGGTSLPVGGESTHCVLTGHRGLSSARLFTDLDQMKEADTFSISVLNETLTYEVDQIRIVMPTGLSQIQIEKGKDYCTLQTCTPYGINTHRLLIRGHRIENPDGDAKILADALQIRPVYVGFVLSIFFLLILVIVVLIFTSSRFKNRSEEMKETYLNY